MAPSEKRLPREAFTKKLRRLCERLDGPQPRTVAFKDWFHHDPQTSDVSITSLWVVGSYARGAPDCGDLDVVVTIKWTAHEPSTRAVARTFFGTLPYVRYYSGDPKKNTSGVEFPEAVLIWSAPGCNWASAITSVRLDPTAGRAARETDVIPLRLEQLYGEINDLKKLVEKREQGVLEWEFVEIDRGLLSPIEEDPFRNEDLLLRYASGWGQKPRQLVPAIIRLMRQWEPYGSWSSSRNGRTTMKCGGTEVRVGQPAVWLHHLDQNLSLRQLALVPSISARGPNGAWIVRRGLNHPDLKTLGSRYVYYLADEEGRPDVVSAHSEGDHWGGGTDLLDLFSTKEAAQHQADGFNEGDEPFNLNVGRADGAEILALTGLSEAIYLDGTLLAVEHGGTRYAETDKISKVEDLAAALPKEVRSSEE